MASVKEYYATEDECKIASSDRMKLEIGYDPDAPTQYYWDWGLDENGWYVIMT